MAGAFSVIKITNSGVIFGKVAVGWKAFGMNEVCVGRSGVGLDRGGRVCVASRSVAADKLASSHD